VILTITYVNNTKMKFIRHLMVLPFISYAVIATAQSPLTADDKKSLEKTTREIRDAFARGDIETILSLHHPDIVKYFGGDNVINGRVGLKNQLTGMFSNAKIEFIDNKEESLIFTGETAIQTSIFTIRSTPKNGGAPTIYKGRAMVVFVRYKDSPTGWASIREMTQDAPGEK
jgi:ketosteroid isomerase-like protein